MRLTTMKMTEKKTAAAAAAAKAQDPTHLEGMFSLLLINIDFIIDYRLWIMYSVMIIRTTQPHDGSSPRYD